MSKADARRFEALIEPHLEALFRAAFRLSRDRADAEDLVQETCARAYARIGQLRESQPVRGWLLRVMQNLFIDGARRERLASAAGAADAAGGDAAVRGAVSDPEASAAATEREEELQRAWSRLDGGQQVLLALRAEGYTHAEIGEITGLAPDVLNARLYRARQSFARHLTDERGAAPGIRMEVVK